MLHLLHTAVDVQALGMRRIFVSRFSGVLSAYGIHLADIVMERQEPCASLYTPEAIPGLLARLDGLEKAAKAELVGRGFGESSIVVERFLNMRFAGTDCAIMTKLGPGEEDYGQVRGHSIHTEGHEKKSCMSKRVWKRRATR
jgi:5-oxoprolinase (ATP-hydrolysing)